MWEHREATNLLTRLFLLFVLAAHLPETARALSDKRLCADENCKEIISLGTGKINYRAGEEGMVSFKINSPIRIKSKSAGNNPSLWGIEVNGREGYAPKEFIRETKIFIGEKNLRYTVDVEQKTKVPVLSTSEKLVELGNTLETTTTKPLNITPTESSENVLNNSSIEKITTETTPVATPVISKTVDGTKVPIFWENGTEKSLQGKSDSAENNVEEAEKNVQDKTEIEIKPKTDKENEDNIKQEKNHEQQSSETSKEQTKVNELKIDNEINQTENLETKQEKETKFNQTNSENAFTNGTNISNANDTKTNVPENEVHKEQSKTKDNELKTEKPMVSLSPVKDFSTTNKNLPNIFKTAKEQTANLDNVETKTNTETLRNDLDNKKNQKVNDNLQSNVLVKDIEEVKEIYEIEKDLNFNTTEQSTVNSEIATDQELPTNKANLSNAFTEVEKKTNLTSEINNTDKIISEKKVNIHQTHNKTPLPQVNIDKKTTVGDTNDLSAEKADISSDEENIAMDSVSKELSNSLPEEKAIRSNDKLQENEETIELKDEAVSEESITKENYYLTEAEENTKRNNQVVAYEPPAYDTLFKNIINDSFKNLEDVDELVQSSTIDNNSLSSHNQQESNNKVFTEVPLKQSKVDNINKIGNINSIPTEALPYQEKVEKISSDSVQNNEEAFLSTTYPTSEALSSQSNVLKESINPTTHNPKDDVALNTPLQPPIDFVVQDHTSVSMPLNDNHVPQENLVTTDNYNSESTETVYKVAYPEKIKDEQTKVIPPSNNFEPKENKGLFSTIMGTVNNMLSNNKKKQNEFEGDNELDRILYSEENINHNNIQNSDTSFPYCKNIGPNGDCPEPIENHDHSASHSHLASAHLFGSDFTLDVFLQTLASKILELSEMLAFLVIAATASLFFVFGYYCFCNSSREGALLLKLNQLESSLLASHKENAILKHNLMSTRQKLASIEDNSFGSNDMVVSLKKELEEELLEKARLQEQITVLQKELENAADAGIELNKIVSELLSNQTGDESIISSVEELQKQLNEQQNTIYEINASLAEKSRENSELQLMLAEQNARYEAELANVQRDNDELEHEKGNLLTRLEEMKTDFDKDITAALEGKNFEIKRLQNEISELSNKLENEHTKWQTSVAKIEALEECLKSVRRDPKVNISEVIDVANVKAQLIEIQKKYKSVKERFETELDSKKLAENQLEVVSAEVEKLKQDFNQSEKDKLEAQTRLEVLSNYFKDKENQLQKELSLKEAMWLKQQGETTTTVDRLTAMQEEIQSLKSQNDSLRAEIEAQAAAHKAQTGTLENRAHETWLAARQSDRRYEEARAEATALRRKLTALGGGNVNESNKLSAGPATMGDELTQAPSPIHMESPGSPMLGRMPPPPFLPPPFMGPPPPFMGMPPPPPFVPPGEMRPAPLGRIMSPPPQRSGRFSPPHLDYEDYLHYDSNNTWHRHTFSPPPRTYRSLSPTDSRYNYGTERDIMSTYDTETDFSPPPSPRESRRREGNSSERIDSNTKISYGNTKKFNSSKGRLSSGSEKSFNTHLHNDTKTKKGNATVGGKNLV